MEIWIKEVTNRLNRNKADILFSEHAAKDKNLVMQDVDFSEKTVRFGKVDEKKSTEEKGRICFKNYFKEKSETYFVIVECNPDFIKIITVNKKKGKY